MSSEKDRRLVQLTSRLCGFNPQRWPTNLSDNFQRRISTVDKPTTNPHGAQAELQEQALNPGEEHDGDTSDKPASTNGAAPPPNGHAEGDKPNDADGTPPGAGASEREEGSGDNLRDGGPYTDSDSGGDAPSAKAHAEERKQRWEKIRTLYDARVPDLEFNFDAAYRHLEVTGRASGKVLFQTFDNNKPRLAKVNEISREWNAAERKLA